MAMTKRLRQWQFAFKDGGVQTITLNPEDYYTSDNEEFQFETKQTENKNRYVLKVVYKRELAHYTMVAWDEPEKSDPEKEVLPPLIEFR